MVVTGGASGIGRALARRFAAEGARNVIIADRDEDGARAVAKEIDGAAYLVDVARGSRDRRPDRNGGARARADRSVLFQRRVSVSAAAPRHPDKGWQRIWEINVMAHVWAARHLIPRMIARGGGYLLNTASAAGLLSQIGSAPYAVTKHAAVGLAEWLAITHGDDGIKVSVLCPQAVRTAMTAGNEDAVASIDGMMEPEEVAAACLRAIEAEEFLILPHPEVLDYMRRKSADYGRWIGGMRKLNRRFRG